MDEDSYNRKYGDDTLKNALRMAASIDTQKANFIFPFGTNVDTKEFINDTLSFLKTSECVPIADTILELPHLGNGIHTSIHKAALDSNSPLVSNHYKGQVIPIVTTGFVKAAVSGGRPAVYHDYIQDVLQNTFLKPLLLDRKLLILSPVDTDDNEFFPALARLGSPQFPFWQEGVKIDLKSLYEQMQNFRTYAKREKRTECRHSRANENPIFSKTCGSPLSRG